MPTSIIRIVVTLGLGCLTAVGQTTFSDTEFPDANWTHALIVDTGGGSTVSVGQSSGGNPGPSQEGTSTFAMTLYRSAHLLNGAVYNPATQGAVSSVSFVFDFATLDGSGSCGPVPSDPGEGADVLLRQGPAYYTTPPGIGPSQSQGWVTLQEFNLTASDFGHITQTGIDTSVNPDFSSAGLPIQFGYLTQNSTASSFCSRTWGTDNYSVTINTVECFLVVGDGPGSATFFEVSHLFETQLDQVEGAFPVLMQDIPEFVLPAPITVGRIQPPTLGNPGFVSFSTEVTAPQEAPAWMLDGHFAVQVLMWNPQVFPAMPEQYTAGLFVWVLSDGTVRTIPYGTDTGGMEIWHEIDTNAAGQKVIRFPFSIPGM